MTTDYDLIAAEYKRAKQQPWRMHLEYHTLFGLLGDLDGKSVLDLACGEGFYTRFFKRNGARRALGVDLSRGMIDLALEEERRAPLGVEYLQHDALTLDLGASFDLVAAAYLLNYANDYDALLGMSRAIARHLVPGGRFVTVNNNPLHPRERFADSRKYGFTKRADEPLAEGTPVAYLFHLDDGQTFEITNYHLDIATHERALREAGFRDIAWHVPVLAPGAADGHPPGYWETFLQHPPVICLECTL